MNDQELELSEQVSPHVIYQQDKAQIDVQITTAKAYPRNIKRATENALAIVTIDKETAQTCTYSVKRGKDEKGNVQMISGPSVHLAKILSQMWGNMRIEAKVVAIDDKHVTSEAICFDLENNLAIKTQVKRSIRGRSGRFSNDMITVTGNAANSIALRNAILSVIPRAIVDKVYNSAKQMITGDISDKSKFISRKKQVLDGLRDTYSLTEKEILSAIGRAAIDHITPDDLVTLIGIGQAIKDGDTTVDYAFKGVKDTAQMSTEEKKAERIVLMIQDCTSLEDLKKIEKDVPMDLVDFLTAKKDELAEAGKGTRK